jgi:uncharacterized protein YbcI
MELIDRGGALEPKRAIARGMVSLFKEYVGRGPTDARAFINEGLVVVLLRDTLTTAERTLAQSEEDEHLVLQLRRGFQGAMRDDAISLVERETGCKVKAFMSDNSLDPDYAVEVFVLGERTENDVDATGDGDGDGTAASLDGAGPVHRDGDRPTDGDGVMAAEAASVPGDSAP